MKNSIFHSNGQQTVKLNSGRSMIEMLAVLTIIGILSIGGLSGIFHVLNRDTADKIMKEALTQASEIKLRRRQKIYSSGDKKGEIKYAYASEYIKSRTYSDDGLSLILKTKNDIFVNDCLLKGLMDFLKASQHHREHVANIIRLSLQPIRQRCPAMVILILVKMKHVADTGLVIRIRDIANAIPVGAGTDVVLKHVPEQLWNVVVI